MQDRRVGRSSLEAFLEILKEVKAEFGKDINVLGNGWIPCSDVIGVETEQEDDYSRKKIKM